MSSCFWPLLDFIGKEDVEDFVPDVLAELEDELDMATKKAIDEVASDLQESLQR